MDDEQRKALSKPFDQKDISKRSDGRGGQLSYVSHGKVTERLNDVLGPDGWHWEELDMIQMQEEVIVKYRMGVPDEKGGIVWKTQYGSARIMYPKECPFEKHVPENIICLGDNFKSAVSDALKKCASLHGVALHLYLGEDAPEQPSTRSGDERRTPASGSASGGEGRGSGGKQESIPDGNTDEVTKRVKKAEKDARDNGATAEAINDLRQSTMGTTSLDQPSFKLLNYEKALIAITSASADNPNSPEHLEEDPRGKEADG